MTERLRTDILAGRFAPGERLLLSKLQSLYDAGAAPVREALARLAVRGLVDFEDQRGFRAKTFDLSELDDLVRTRQDIESLLVRDAIAHGDATWSGDLAEAFAALERTPMYGADRRAIRSEWEAAHRVFHRVLVSGARSVLLKDYHAILWDQARALSRTRRLEGLPGRAHPRRSPLAHGGDASPRRGARGSAVPRPHSSGGYRRDRRARASGLKVAVNNFEIFVDDVRPDVQP